MKYFLVDLAIGLMAGLWMYNNAKKQNLENPGLWIWIGLLFSIAGLIFYIIWYIVPKKDKA